MIDTYFLVIYDYKGDDYFGEKHGYHTHDDWVFFNKDTRSQKHAVLKFWNMIERTYGMRKEIAKKIFSITDVRELDFTEKQIFIDEWAKHEPPKVGE